MRKEKYYTVYDTSDRLNPGNELKIHHEIVQGYRDNTLDLTPFIGMGKESLSEKRDASAKAEQAIFDKIRASVKEWERQAAVTKTYSQAIEYLEAPEATHTSNQWINLGAPHSEKISNMVYEMTVSIRERTEYNRLTHESKPVAWYASWEVDMRSPKYGRCVEIARQSNKRFTSIAAAQKYIEGRKKAYAKYFQEISPQVPQIYAGYYKVNDVLLPGYTVQGQEPAVSTITADEIINEILGVDSVTKDKKPSVLKKLAEGNKAKTASARGAKDKEEQSI